MIPLTTVEDFDQLKLNRQLLNAILDAGYTAPTRIQEMAIPRILSGQDVLGIAQTGTGKTAAYVLPLLMKVKFAQGDDPRALVIVPTRELVVQVLDQFIMLGKYTDLRYVGLFGGTGMKSQKEQLEKGCDILVATPGRLMDLYLEGHVTLKKIQCFVLDEAERLLDMGFKPQINRILEVVPRKRQNLLFSATWSNKVKRISDDFLESPTEIRIDPEIRTAKTVSQAVYFTPNIRTKIRLLDFLLEANDRKRTIIFCKTKASATDVAKFLERKYGMEIVRVIHGNKAQNTRLNAIESFREGVCRFLVTTDVAARGIDIPDVDLVVNFDVPLVYEDYIHRIGRTGRIFRTGASVTFCAPQDDYHLNKIQQLISESIPVLDLPQGIEVTEMTFEEKQEQLREIDAQRRKSDPEYKGAFHEKKWKNRR
ncbi:MAG: DEAD/DEAH box helicase [Bacteroidota bacterium]